MDKRAAVQNRKREGPRDDAPKSSYFLRGTPFSAYSALPPLLSSSSFFQYHTGFRHQVSSWPSNPVMHYIERLSSYPTKTVIADLGAGDAALARTLVPQGMTVLSFDLVADGKYVVEADTCSRLPLPGSESGGGVSGDEEEEKEAQEAQEEGVKGEGAGGVVDVVVCALSLMGTNWPGTIREAWRILRPGCVLLPIVCDYQFTGLIGKHFLSGELMIAEVASRFTDIDTFAGFVSSFGFKLKKKVRQVALLW